MNRDIKILHLEDNVADAKLIHMNLLSSGLKLQVEKVQTRAEFESALNNNSYDLILADFNLPGYDGLSALRYRHKVCPETPFIFVSGTLGEDAAIEGLTQGATDYVLKQKLSRLVPSVKRALNEVDIQREKKRTEAELKESRERLEAVFINAVDGILVADMERKKFVVCNPMICRMLGYSSEEILSLGVLEIHPEKDLPKIVDQFERQARKEYSLAKNIPVERKDGTIFFADINSFPIFIEGRQCLAGFFRDVSEYKMAEDELRKLSQAVEQSPVSIMITDLMGSIEYVNSKFERLTGYSKSEVLGKNPRILKSGAKSLEEYLVLWKTITSGKEWRGEFQNRKKNGELYWELASISPILNSDGVITHFLAVKEDITIRKQFEQELILAKDKAEESDKLKTAFLHNISHEIRTPMNGIVGFSSLLRESEQDRAERESYIDSIIQSSDNLCSIVNDIIEISNLEAGLVRCNTNNVAPNRIIKSLHKQFEPEAVRKGLLLKSKVSLAGEDAIILSDEAKIVQILSNLLNNAIKFTRTGQIEFGYFIDKDFIEFRVSDTGIGIPMELHEKVFKRFYQVENDPTRQYGGTGLGLSICEAYVRLLGGRIWFTSKPGKGSEFCFTIPLNQKERPGARQMFPEKIKSKASFPRTILVVEDNDINSHLINLYLSGTETVTLRATNGKEAVELCKSRDDIDLILMDLKMPEMDGLTATKLIKELCPEIPVIAQTAYISEREVAMNVGCSDFLSKPFRKEELLDMLKKHYKSRKK